MFEAIGNFFEYLWYFVLNNVFRQSAHIEAIILLIIFVVAFFFLKNGLKKLENNFKTTGLSFFIFSILLFVLGIAISIV